MDVQPDYRILLRPVQDECPAAVRLRRLLKVALRAFGLRYIDLEEVPARPPESDAGASGGVGTPRGAAPGPRRG
jgi:hypothetical protein